MVMMNFDDLSSETSDVPKALVQMKEAWARGAKLEAIAIVRQAIRDTPESAYLRDLLAKLWMELDRPELADEWASALDEETDHGTRPFAPRPTSWSRAHHSEAPLRASTVRGRR
jgi:hypothetical protein